MYDKTITILIKSNLGSFVKEDIFNGHLIEKDREDEYYEGISRILLSDNKGYIKDGMLMEYLMQNNRT